MAKNFNFQAKLGLDSKGFKKGVRGVQFSLNGLKSTFRSFAAGLGATLGLERLVSSLKDTATQLSVAKATLKNVSEITKTYNTETGVATIRIDNYGKNLEFVRELSNKYGQDLLALIDSYAKFTAAAKGSSISLKDQEKIYHALTRAAATYHLSADQTRDMMNAVIQMMSKGKVAAEELRRQLGNTLPGAFNIFAEAEGVSIAKLEEMMRNGELLASDILPKVADRLMDITANAHFDSLQTSLNLLKNAWTEFTEKSGAEEMFKNLVDFGTDALEHLTENFKIYSTSIKWMLLGLIPAKLFSKGLTNSIKFFRNFKSNTIAEIDVVNKRMNDLQKNIDKLTGGFNPAGYNGFDAKNLVNANEEAIQNMIEYNDLLQKRDSLEKSIGKTTLSTYTRTKTNIKGNTTELANHLYNLQRTNAQIANGGKSWIGWGRAFKIAGKGILSGLKSIGRAIKSFLGPIGLIMVAVEGVLAISGAIVGNLKKEREEREKIAGIVGDSDNRISESMTPTNEDIKKIQKVKEEFDELFKAGNDANAKHKFKELQELIPSLKNITYEDLKKRADGFNELTAAVNNYNAAKLSADNYKSLEEEIGHLDEEIGNLKDQKKDLEDSGKPLTRKVQGTRAGGDYGSEYTVKTETGQKLDFVNNNLEKAIEKREELQEKLKNLKVVEEIDYFPPPDTDGTPIEKVYKADKEALKKLENQYKEGAIKQQEYIQKLNQLAHSSYEDAAATGALSIEKIIEKLNKGDSLTAIEKWYKELVDRVAMAITMEGLDKLSDEILKEVEEEINKFEELAEKQLNFEIKMENGEYEPGKLKERFRGFDYKKSSSEIAGEEYDVARENVDNLDDAIKKLKEDLEETLGEGATNAKLKEMQADLVALEKAATSWEEAMKLEEMLEDLKNLEKELKELQISIFENSMGGVSSFVSSVDSVVNSFQRLQDVMENNDSSAWDHFIATFEIFESIMNGLITTMQTFNTIMELSNNLKDISAQKQTLLNNIETQGNIVTAAAAAAKSESANASTANAAATAADAAASAMAAKAKAKEAVAETAKQNAKMGPLGWLGAVAGVAAIVAALSSMSKFAGGGIVGGSSTRGDKNLARLNSGEMVLNKAQQGTLWNMLNGKGGIGGNVNFKIRGSDLVGTIENYNSKRRG